MSQLIRGRRVGASLIQGRIDSLTGGISQQPPPVRPPGKCEDTLNTWPSPVEGLTRRRPTRLVRRVTTATLSDLWSGTALPQAGERYQFTLFPDGANTRLDVSLNGQPCSLDVHGLGLAASGSSITCAPNSYLYRASGLRENYRLINSGAIALLLNRNITARLKDELSPPIPSDGLIFVQSVAFDVGFVVTLNGTPLPEYRTPKATDTINTLSTAVTATELATRINAVAGFTAQAVGALVYVNRLDGAAFTLALDDSRSGALARVLKDTVPSFNSLPAVGRQGFYIKVTSDPVSTSDDYWVRFVANNSSSQFGEGVWSETVAPGVRFKLNDDTMPIVIYRAAPGVLFIGPADGAARSITVGPTTYNYTFPLWGERTAGDESTVPTPSFEGKQIRDHRIHRGRYVVVAGDSIVHSETDNIFNFFQDTSTTVLDTDPIDILTPAEGSSTPRLEWMIAAGESLLATSADGQYQVRAADGEVLTPRTAECVKLSAIDMNTLLPPRLAGPNVLIGTTESGFTGFREYQFIETETRRLGLNLGGSLSITSEVPRLIPGLADQWDVSEGLDYMVVSSPVDRTKLYVYKYLWSTSQNAITKQQSAWGVWQFDGQVQWVSFFDNRLWMLISYPDGTYLVDMPTPELRDPADPELCLDRQIQYPENTGIIATYNAGANRTTFTLPYAVTAETVAVIRFSNSRQKGLHIGATFSGNTIVCSAPGDWRTDQITIGTRYLSRHQFTTAHVPARSDTRDRIVGDQTGRLQILNWSVFHSNSGPYNLRVRRKNRISDSVMRFSPRQLNVQLNTLDTFAGALDTGRVRTMVATRNLDCAVFVESDSAYPFTITGAAWEGSYNDRAQSLS